MMTMNERTVSVWWSDKVMKPTLLEIRENTRIVCFMNIVFPVGDDNEEMNERKEE